MKFKILSIFIIISLFGSCVTIKKSGLDNVRTQPRKPIKKTETISIPSPNPPMEDMVDDKILPDLKNTNQDQATLPNKYLNRQYNINLKGGDIKDILSALVKDTEIGLIINPDVQGSVPVIDLKDVTLKEILEYLLPPLDLEYQQKGKNLRIYKTPLEYRYFCLNYISANRAGKRDVSFSTRSNTGSSNTGGITGGSISGTSGSTSGGGQNQSSSTVKVDYQNQIWKTFIDSLKVLIFNTTSGVNELGSSSTDTSTGGAKSFAYKDDQGRILIVSPQTGVVVIKAYKKELNEVASFIEKYEGSAQRQVWIEAKILEVTLSNAFQMGIDWGLAFNSLNIFGNLPKKRTLFSQMHSFTPGDVSDQSLTQSASGVYQFAASNRRIDFLIDAISTQGSLKVLASPRISTLNNEKAVIRVVREEAFFNLQTQISQGYGGNVTAPTINVQTIPIGIVMDIIPQIDSSGNIILSVNPDISELLEVKKFEVQGAMATQPVIDRRSIDTTAKLKAGQTLIIAGIMKERKQEVLKGVPFLYKLPLIGKLFRRTEQRVDKTELVIMITPKVISGKSHLDLTIDEKQRVLDAIKPMKLGDVASIKEIMKGETQIFKKKNK